MDNYETLDIYRAAFLELAGFKITLEQNRAGRVVFCIAQSADLDEAIERYDGKEPVAAIVYADRIKDLKRRMFTAGNGRGFDGRANRR